jgi:aspartyl-tRNA(Asn)/glutamyl-tRNA(Gln) amidotransferase subunit B
MASTKVFAALISAPEKTALEISAELNLVQEQDNSQIEAWVDDVLARLPEKVKEYQNGKKGLLGLFAGEVKKLSKGKADMQLTNEVLGRKLDGVV